MRKLRIYLDTSVISYLLQEDAQEKMEQTQELWKILKMGKYEIVISDLVFSEIEECDETRKNLLKEYLLQIYYNKVELTEEVEKLAFELIKENVLTPKSYDDCLHISYAIVNNCDIILSWDFKHMVNLRTINGVRRITFANRYNSIDIYAPYVLLGDKSGGEKNEKAKIKF